MSANDNLRQLIRKYIKEVLKELEETSFSSGAGAYNTPFAFSGGRDKDKKKKKNVSTNSTGYKIVEAAKARKVVLEVPKNIYGGMRAVFNSKKAALSYMEDNIPSEAWKHVKIRSQMVPVRESINEKFDQRKLDKHLLKAINYLKQARYFAKQKQPGAVWDRVGDAKFELDYHAKKYYESVNEAGMGILDSDQADILQGIVLKNKNKNTKAILNLALRSGHFKGVDKKELLGYIDGARQFVKYMKSHPMESVNEGKYHTWRNDESLTPKQKIGRSMREIRDHLTEIDKLTKMNVRLKREMGVDSRDYWKNTHKALSKISERLVKLAKRVGEIY